MVTGFTTDLWLSASLTLTANQDGSVFADEKRSGINDNGTVTIDDAASAPTPFPALVVDDDNIEFRFLVVNEEAADFDVAYGLVEDWVIL